MGAPQVSYQEGMHELFYPVRGDFARDSFARGGVDARNTGSSAVPRLSSRNLENVETQPGNGAEPPGVRTRSAAGWRRFVGEVRVLAKAEELAAAVTFL